MARTEDNYTAGGPLLEGRTAEEFGEEGPARHQGQNRSPRQIESQAGRKQGWAKRTAGAKNEATRAAKGGALKKAKGPHPAQKAGRQKAASRKRAA